MNEETAATMLERSWARTWLTLGRTAPPGLYQRLLARYEEPQRHYHTVRHLIECLVNVEEMRSLAPHPVEVELAVWFHDAIYDVTRHDNEARSADLAEQELLAAGVEADRVARIRDLILQTRHAAEPVGMDAQVLVDADLSILAAAPARFDEYERQIRTEYAHVPDQLFAKKRREILESFLTRPAIFTTRAFRAAHEEAARANLRRSLAR